jgi:hypothetical protein
MGKKWKRLLVQRRKNGRIEMPVAQTEPAISNAAVIEEMEAAAPEPEVVEETPVPEPEVAEEAPVVEEEPVVETPKPKRRRSTRRKKTVSED